nr:GntR family transcriptional regulator [uncultured Anaeromusa sp.]
MARQLSLPINRQPLSEQVYHQIKKLILTGQLEQGTRLTEKTLAQDLGISPTPVRESLRRLYADGLVELQPYKGVIVRSVKPEEVLEAFACREALEGLAGSLAAKTIDAEGIAKLRDVLARTLQEESRDALVKLNEEFHQVILEYAQNRRLFLLLDTLQDIIRFRRQLAAYNPEYKGSIYRQHSAIADALEKKDSEKASLLLQEHIQDSAASFAQEIHGNKKTGK